MNKRHPRPNPLPRGVMFVRPSDVARAIARSAPYIYARIRDGRIPAVRLDGALRIKLDDAISWIESVTEEDLSKPNPECPKCHGTGYVENTPCDCWRLIQ